MSKLVFAAVVLVVGLGLYGALRRQADRLPAGLRSLGPGLVLVLAIGIPAAILAFSVLRIIPAGQVGVKVLFGQVETVPLREGLNLLWNPLYDIVTMDTRVGRHTAKYDAASKDLQAVHVEMVLNYRLIPERAPEVYRGIGLGYSSVIIDPAAQEVLKANTAIHNAAEILLKRPAIKADIQRDLTVWLAKYGIELKEAALANIRFDPNYEKRDRGQADRGAEGRAEALRADPGPAPGRDRGGRGQGQGGRRARGGPGRGRGPPAQGRGGGHLQREGLLVADPGPHPAAVPRALGRPAPAV